MPDTGSAYGQHTGKQLEAARLAQEAKNREAFLDKRRRIYLGLLRPGGVMKWRRCKTR